MAINCVVPSQQRIFDKDGKFVSFYSPPRYRVDTEALPDLVARGVMPFRFLTMREDFEARFKGCETPEDVRGVLAAEGFYE